MLAAVLLAWLGVRGSAAEAVRERPGLGLREVAVLSLVSSHREVEVRRRIAALTAKVRLRVLVEELLVQQLKDPCYTVGHEVVVTLIDHFQLREADGDAPEIVTMWRGGAVAYERCRRREIIGVAELLRQVDPALVSAEEIEGMRSRVPPDPWSVYVLDEAEGDDADE